MPALTFLSMVIRWALPPHTDAPPAPWGLGLGAQALDEAGQAKAVGGWGGGFCTRPLWAAEGAPGPAHSPVPSDHV